MPILVSDEILEEIEKEISCCNASFIVVSAFCKESLIEYFDSILPMTVKDKRLIVRLLPADIVSGATDLSLYTYCQEHDWKMFFRLDLHAKTYIFDNIRCIVGSANATNRGLCVGGAGNYEMAMASVLSEGDVKAIEGLFLNAVPMSDEIFTIMSSTVDNIQTNSDKHCEWPDEIKDMFHPDYNVIFSEDFPQTFEPQVSLDNELGFFHSNRELSKDEMRTKLESSKCFLWLKELLISSEDHQMYFGEITQRLHEILLDDPKPYRKDVKTLLANLLNWIEVLECNSLTIDKPNHSQRVRYYKESENV